MEVLIILENFSAKLVRRGSRINFSSYQISDSLVCDLRLHYHDWRGAGFGCHKMKKIVAGLGNTYKSLHETDGSIRGTP